ncbi:MAG: DUF4956 domain-containing protein [Oscillospiraceae bacterium]|nr:DUF4956 domain-containing protein [Oscillospiraceae bacterium]MBQ8378318.1 DUF4956 domain-containing protein [Oscillospiraceae bacterium]MBQ8884338.1 DUF4956 domain-containing protein [Oscillospiraceae bacterium]
MLSANIFKGIFDNELIQVISPKNFLLCLVVALALGIFLALVYTFKSRYTKSFVVTLAMLPAVVCVVIMMVNGNVGAGVAVAGAFNLVRFRSVPGTAKEIGTIFLAMCAGIVVGMGYFAFAITFTVILGLFILLCSALGLGTKKSNPCERVLRITIPEDLNYTEVFDDLMEKYTSFNEIERVKTVNMGSMFRLTYNIRLKDAKQEKEFIDEIRCRNGNLEVSMAKPEVNLVEL